MIPGTRLPQEDHTPSYAISHRLIVIQWSPVRGWTCRSVTGRQGPGDLEGGPRYRRARSRIRVASMSASPPPPAEPSPSPENDTSLTLMMRIQQNPTDGSAWDEFVRLYHPMIRAWCLKWGSQATDADDVAQDVLLRLLGAMKKFQYDPSRSFRAWLKTVTQNAWHDFVRSRKQSGVAQSASMDLIADSHDALEDLEKRMEDAFEGELLELALRHVKNRVKPATWMAFQLTALENRTGAEAAKELQMQVAHVFVAKHRVHKMLEEEIEILRGGRA